jgi:collagen beta-1,O-galactosyltransferase
MKVYVVNLKRRPDRRERMERLLPREWQAEYTTDWPGPLDGQTLDPDALPGFRLFPWQISADNPWWNRPLKRGEIGCAVSHWLCWKNAHAAHADRALILEDDVSLCADGRPRLTEGLARLEALDSEWDLVYLGRWPLEPDEPVVDGIIRPGYGIVRPGYSYCTYAYMLSAAGLGKVLAADFDQALIPVDELLPALYMDHPREDVRRQYPKRLNAYAFEPPLVTQLPKDEAGSDTEASEFVASGLPGAPEAM